MVWEQQALVFFFFHSSQMHSRRFLSADVCVRPCVRPSARLSCVWLCVVFGAGGAYTDSCTVGVKKQWKWTTFLSLLKITDKLMGSLANE